MSTKCYCEKCGKIESYDGFFKHKLQDVKYDLRPILVEIGAWEGANSHDYFFDLCKECETEFVVYIAKFFEIKLQKKKKEKEKLTHVVAKNQDGEYIDVPLEEEDEIL